MIAFQIRVVPLVWTLPTTPDPKPNPFRASWDGTLELLDRELSAIEADPDTVTLAVDLRPDQIRRDGQPRAGAKAGWRGVILSFDCRHGSLSYPCDTFEARWHGEVSWQANTRAIALGLEALRQVDRYGIAVSGQQYRGFRELGSGEPGDISFASIEAAADYLIACGAGDDGAPEVSLVISDKAVRDRLYRRAARRLHPDTGTGDEEAFKRLGEALDMLAGGGTR